MKTETVVIYGANTSAVEVAENPDALQDLYIT